MYFSPTSIERSVRMMLAAVTSKRVMTRVRKSQELTHSAPLYSKQHLVLTLYQNGQGRNDLGEFES
jgi:hypothetical protein